MKKLRAMLNLPKNTLLNPKWKQELWETNLYGLSRRIEADLFASITFRNFRREVNEVFAVEHPDAKPPSRRTLKRLYERALWARCQRELIEAVQGIKKSANWRAHRHWAMEAIQLTNKTSTMLRNCEEMFLWKGLMQKVRSVTKKLGVLHMDLVRLQRFDAKLDEMSKQRTWNEVLQLARLRMDRILKDARPRLRQDQRVAIISIVTERTKLKEEETTEAVKQFLYRTNRCGSAAVGRGCTPFPR